MHPPPRFKSASFDTYHIEEPSQATAVEAAMEFLQEVRQRQSVRGKFARWLRGRTPHWSGLYFVGPVGTGKTHLLASVYHALNPEIPCAFMHAAALFRLAESPDHFAERIAARYRVFCLDEVEIDDPANEVRLIRTLRALEKRDVVLMATSNVEPERFLAAQVGNDRFRRFLNEEFRRHYRVVFVGGDDYRQRLERHGRAWIGEPEAASEQMRLACDADPGRTRWITGDELMRMSTEIAHSHLMRILLELDALYLENLCPADTDDALRLLRIMDDLYLAPAAPILYWTSPVEPEYWLNGQARGIEKGISEKFIRTTSRLRALCDVEHVSAVTEG
jgi:cell division protein ZapE